MKIRLEYRDIPSHGKEIYAYLGKEVKLPEFTMRGDISQPVLIGCEPFIQFQSKEWKDILDKIFTGIVELWNNDNTELTEMPKDMEVKNEI